MDGLYSNFATEEVVTAEPYLVERGTRNSNKSTYWINLLKKLNKMSLKLHFKPCELYMSYHYTTNLRIFCDPASF